MQIHYRESKFTIRLRPLTSYCYHMQNLLIQPQASSESTDSFSIRSLQTSTHTCDFKTPLNGFGSPQTLILYSKTSTTPDLENCQRHMLCILANHLTKHTLLVIGQIQDGFSTSRNKSSSLVLKSCKFVQETSEKVLCFKAQQISQQNHINQDLMMKLDSSSIEAVSVKNYEIRISKYNFVNIY